MPTLTITDIDVGREYRVFAQDDKEGVTHIYATLRATLVIAEGETRLGVDKTVELTGTPRTRAIALFQDIKAIAKAEEGIA